LAGQGIYLGSMTIARADTFDLREHTLEELIKTDK
jgi:hypothetical protein